MTTPQVSTVVRDATRISIAIGQSEAASRVPRGRVTLLAHAPCPRRKIEPLSVTR